jgi:hypothetical protein
MSGQPQLETAEASTNKFRNPKAKSALHFSEVSKQVLSLRKPDRTANKMRKSTVQKICNCNYNDCEVLSR